MKKILTVIIILSLILSLAGCAFEEFDKYIIEEVSSSLEPTVESTEKATESTPEETTAVPTEKSTEEEKTTEEKTTAEKTTEKQTSEPETSASKTTEEPTTTEPESTTKKEELPDLSGVWKGEKDSVIVLNKDFTGRFYASRTYYKQGDTTVHNLTYEITDDKKVYIDDVFDFRIVSPVNTSTLHFVPQKSTNKWSGEVFVRHPELTEADIIQERIDSYTEAPTTAAPTTTAESQKKLTANDLIGTFLGDDLSVIHFYSNGQCVYQEPTNKNSLNLRRGISCRYTVSGSRVTITGAATYDIYADLSNNKEFPVNSFLVQSTNSSWSNETFTRNASDNPVKQAAENSSFILPSSSREITDFDLDLLSKAEVRLARNEILAKHGRKFKDAELRAYFNNKTWYNGTIDGTTFDSQLNKYLTDIELKNVDFINAYESAH